MALPKGRLAGVMLASAIGLVGAWEGRRFTAYPDIIGVWTICDGDTRGVKANQTATPAECDRRLYERLQEIHAQLEPCIDRAVPEPVYVATLSLAYNAGPSAICKSTLVRKLRAGDIEGACNEFPRWVYAGGEKLQGLVNRRAAERDLCLSATRDNA